MARSSQRRFHLDPDEVRPWLYAGGLLYQALVVLQLSRSPFFGNPILDARYQVEWALALARGVDPHPVFFQSPLYSYLLAGFLRVAGWHVWPVVLAQVLLVLLVARLVERTLELLEVRGALRGVFLGVALFYPLYPYYASQLHKTTLEIFLYALVMYLGTALLARERPLARYLGLAAAFGLVCGLAALTRATFQAVAVLPCLLVPRQRLATLLAVFLAFLGPFGWASLHNYRGAGEWVPLQTSFGFTLFLGNNPWNPQGAQLPVPGLSNRPLEEEASSREYAEQRSGRPLTVAQVNDFFVARVLEFARNDPAAFLSAQAHKLYWYLHREELPDDDCYRDSFLEAPALAWNPLGWGWIAAFALPAVALVACSWKWRARCPPAELFVVLLPLVFLAVAMLFYVSSRLRVGHVALWLPVLGLGFEQVLRFGRQRAATLLAVGCLALLPGLAMALTPPLQYPPDETRTKRARILLDLGRFDEAQQQIQAFANPSLRRDYLAHLQALRALPDPSLRPRYLVSPRLPQRGGAP